MLKERIKSTVILILIINIFYLTAQLLFVHGSKRLGNELVRYAQDIPIVSTFFPADVPYSIPKQNLSMPRKFLVNDGSLWMAYYNTDIGFSPIEKRIRPFIKALLNGEYKSEKKISYRTWESGLESYSIYVEYSNTFSMPLFCKVMDVAENRSPKSVGSVRDLLIIPSSSDSNICILLHDTDGNSYYAYILDKKYRLPAEDLSVYSKSTDGYFEPAFSTELKPESKNDIRLSPLVLFSDSQPKSYVLKPRRLLNDSVGKKMLDVFALGTETKPYKDAGGTLNYIGNYSSAKLYSDSVFEYTALSTDKGILLDEGGDEYTVLNGAIDFAEKVWSVVSYEPLNVLLTSDLSRYDPNKPFKFNFDYYCNGRPISLNLADSNEHSPLKSAIEITVQKGRIISYRQYLCSYINSGRKVLESPFVSALDYFINDFDKTNKKGIVIEDIYIGYLDEGNRDRLDAQWLASINTDNKIYKFTPEAEVSEE